MRLEFSNLKKSSKIPNFAISIHEESTNLVHNDDIYKAGTIVQEADGIEMRENLKECTAIAVISHSTILKKKSRSFERSVRGKREGMREPCP